MRKPKLKKKNMNCTFISKMSMVSHPVMILVIHINDLLLNKMQVFFPSLCQRVNYCMVLLGCTLILLEPFNKK